MPLKHYLIKHNTNTTHISNLSFYKYIEDKQTPLIYSVCVVRTMGVSEPAKCILIILNYFNS